MTVERCDVIVIGLGPAGASAAAAAARAGCSVLAVERKHAPGLPVQCAEFVPAMVGIDVGNLAASSIQHIGSMATYIEDDAADIRDQFPGHMIDRAGFDAGLVRDAQDSGAHCRFGVCVRQVAADGAVALSDDSIVHAEVLIGADGPRSTLGRAIGRVNRELVETRQITVPLLLPHEATDIFLSVDIPGGYGWLFPKSSIANLGAGVEPVFRHKLSEIVSKLHRMLVEHGRVGREVLALTGGLIPVGGMLKPWCRHGDALVLLAGDAAGLTHPVTGAGIASAVHSGRLAGEAARRWLSGNQHAGEDYEEELESIFRAALDRAVARRQELAQASSHGRSGRDVFQRGWIAYPQYWAA